MSAIIFDYKNAKVKDESGKIYFTYDDLVKLPEWPEGPLIEIIHGDLFMVPSPKIKHQEISQKLYDTIKPLVISGKLFYAPVDVVFSEENTVIPDLVYIRKENLEIIKEENIRGVPDLVIEITSTNRKTDLEVKLALYQEFGVAEYIIVDTDNLEIRQCILKEGKYEIKIFTKEEIVKLHAIDNVTIPIVELFH